MKHNIETLPEYFVIQRDNSNPLWKEYIKWLNETFEANWGGKEGGYGFYGFDGSRGGTDCHHKIKFFKNNPLLITLEQWKDAMDNKERKKDKEYTLTKDKILEASRKCPQAEEVLETLFPEAFEEENKLIEIEDFEVNTHCGDKLLYIGAGAAPEEFYKKCLVLNTHYNWEIKDYEGRKVLIPRRKLQ